MAIQDEVLKVFVSQDEDMPEEALDEETEEADEDDEEEEEGEETEEL